MGRWFYYYFVFVFVFFKKNITNSSEKTWQKYKYILHIKYETNSRPRHLILVIDDLDALEHDCGAPSTPDSFDPTPLSPNIVLIGTGADGCAATLLRKGAPTLRLRSLAKREMRLLVEGVFTGSGMAFDENSFRELSRMPFCSSPAVLAWAAREVAEAGLYYENVEDAVARVTAAVRSCDSAATALSAVMAAVFQRIERQVSRTLMQRVMSLLWAVEDGMTEDEIIAAVCGGDQVDPATTEDGNTDGGDGTVQLHVVSAIRPLSSVARLPAPPTPDSRRGSLSHEDRSNSRDSIGNKSSTNNNSNNNNSNNNNKNNNNNNGNANTSNSGNTPAARRLVPGQLTAAQVAELSSTRLQTLPLMSMFPLPSSLAPPLKPSIERRYAQSLGVQALAMLEAGGLAQICELARMRLLLRREKEEKILAARGDDAGTSRPATAATVGGVDAVADADFDTDDELMRIPHHLSDDSDDDEPQQEPGGGSAAAASQHDSEHRDPIRARRTATTTSSSSGSGSGTTAGGAPGRENGASAGASSGPRVTFSAASSKRKSRRGTGASLAAESACEPEPAAMSRRFSSANAG
jgi:hypothetical protein